ncbi:AAA family ATPase [Runella sp.]|uniref:AAA family ATPase n=1 Tax=Runella sp. TaxID=1960881 RepID=UPI003D13B4C3
MWKLTDNKEWAQLEKAFGWVRDMKNTPQDVRHHAEGDVAIHTQMVLDALNELPDYQNLSPESQEILWAAALMHDMEKRSTTVLENDGRITSKGHAKKGEFSARSWLYQNTDTPFEIREQITKLIRHHGLPVWVFEKPDPQKAIIKSSFEVKTDRLGLLAQADMQGRICEDKDDMMYRVELFRQYCDELNCLSNPYTFPSALARFEYIHKEERDVSYLPFDDYTNEVTMLAGLPGTGKDTYLQKHFQGAEVLSLDAIRRELKIKPSDTKATGFVIQQAKETAKSYLRRKQPFILNATNISRSIREVWIDLFVSYKAKVNIIYLEVPYKQMISQNKNREHVVPNDVLQRMISKLDVPALWEAHEVRYVV